MTQITQNNCTIISLIPLEVTCNPTNATNPETQDGSIQLFINGGTSPYTISWESGAQGTSINNLQSGDYTVTVTDYYGDYTETITCTVGSDTFYLDEFIKCSESFNPNVYVFYDGTSLDSTKALQASESIRSWYQVKKNNGFGGLLYEGVIGAENHNGENWLWWSTYPYLGSLTGGTLSDGTTIINSFGLTGDSVNNSIYNSDWCQSNDGGKCVPRNPSFNFSTTVAGGLTSDIYKRINNGFVLTGVYGINDTRSMGVPFTVTSTMDGNYQTVYGDFIGGDKNYICIIISDESNGNVGLYHGDITSDSRDIPNKNDLYENPFVLTGTGWNTTIQEEPSNRFTYDYGSFLKVWEDIKEQGGTFEGFIYPVIDNNVSEIPFLQHTVAVVEGTTISESEFQEKYNTSITNVGPLNLNLSALTHTNVYGSMSATTEYQNLNPTYKNGPGLKNFDWIVNPTVSGFENGVIGNNLNTFFSDISLSTLKIYTEPIDGLVEDTIYKFLEIEGCYSYNQRLFYTGQSYSALTVSNTYDECLKCQPSPPNPIFQPTLCLSNGTTQYEFSPSGTNIDGYFVWVNTDNSLTLSYNTTLNRWEITPWTNIGVGNMVRAVNQQIPVGNFTNLGNSRPLTWVMTEGFCEGISLTLNALPSSELCFGSNDGSVILTSTGGFPPYQYRIQNVSPYPIYSITGIFNNLPSGNYLGETVDNNGNTTSTVFTINNGVIPISYTLSLASMLISSTNGTKTWSYVVQISPSLPVGVSLSFDINLNHLRKYRNSGTYNFNYSHVITKNGNLNIPYNTSIPVTTNTNTKCLVNTVTEYTTTFNDSTNTITFSSNDTSVTGLVTQTVIINGQDANCDVDCRMLGVYDTTLQISNVNITGSNCSSVFNANSIIKQNITTYDCRVQT
jgi:hypothetical protein